MTDLKQPEGNHPPGVGRAIAKGAMWTMSIRLINRSISIISTLILARLLTPTDFGVYALAMTLYAFVELLGAFGFGYALIQNQETTDAHYNTAWTLNFLTSLISGILLFLAAPFAAAFFDEPRLTAVVRFICILFVLDGMRNIGTINFQKDMTFNKEFRYQLLVKLSGFFVTIPLAFVLRSYWAMLFGLLFSSVVMVVLSYVMHPFRPRPGLGCWREMMSFSVWLHINNILNYFNRHGENLMVSRIIGTPALGSLQLARETGQILTEMVQPINRAAFPGYSRVNREPQRMLDVFCDVMALLMMIGFPVAVGIYSTAHLFVPVVLGSQWAHIVPLVELLALVSLMMAAMASTNNVLIAQARMKWATAAIALRLFCLVGFLLYFLPRYGVIGVAYAGLSSLGLVLGFSYFSLRINLQLGLRRVIAVLNRPALAALAMCLLVRGVFPPSHLEMSLLSQVLQLLLAVVSGGACYVIVLCLLWVMQSRPEGPETKVLRIVQARVGGVGWMLPGGKQRV